MDAKDDVRWVANADKPFFQPSSEMRQSYLDARKSELEMFLAFAKGNVWKEVVVVSNHVRGTGAMYSFANVGDAAGNLSKAIQNGDQKCLELAYAYADAVNAAYV